MLGITNLNSIINESLLKNRHVCFVKKTKITKKVLICLSNYGLIKEVQSKGQKYFVVLNTTEADSHKASAFSLKSLSTISRQLFISAYKLQSLSWLNRRKNYLIVSKYGDIQNTFDKNRIKAGGILLSVVISS